MSVGCVLSVNEGDHIVYYGGTNYGDKVIGKTYIRSTGEFPAGHYPLVRPSVRVPGSLQEVRPGGLRVVHPYYYTITKIIRKKL